MKEIEIGEYVRTDKGKIGKVVEKRLGFNKDLQVYQDIYKLDNGLWTILDYIVKHSKQLIDLIECGDCVNGELITDKWDTRISSIRSNFSEEDIKTILTKEMFEANCYKIVKE